MRSTTTERAGVADVDTPAEIVLDRAVDQATLPLEEREEGARPFLKWAGGKRQLLPELLPRVPVSYSQYFEPFLGGGALFFELRPARATLTDVNERLIRTYMGVRDDVEGVIRLLRKYQTQHDKDFFYQLRDKDIDGDSNTEVAAWFIYLNKTGFNGLYRVNRDNRFNVPFGRNASVGICNEATLRACALALAESELHVEGFESVATRARPGDFVYFDPPYMPVSVTSSFTSYTSGGFGPTQQELLRDVARALKKRDVHVLLSNSAVGFIRDLYRDGFEVHAVSATRRVNSKVSGRGAIVELIIQ